MKYCTPDEILNNIDEVKLAEIRKIADKLYNVVSRRKNNLYEQSYISKRAVELAFKSVVYENESIIFKNILASNIAFPDDLSFVYTIKSFGLTLDELKTINDPNIPDRTKYKTIYKIAYYTRRCYGADMTSIVINKINQIIAFNKELFEKDNDYNLDNQSKKR